MLSWIVRLFMFLTSYIPLYIVLIVQYVDLKKTVLEQPFIMVLSSLTLISLVVFELVLYLLSKSRTYIACTNVSKVEMLKEVNSTYLLTYIMPLIAFDFGKTQDCISFLILFVSIMIMYIKYNMVFLNPVLEAFRYTYYTVENEYGDRIILISEKKFNDVHSNYKIKYVNLGQNLYLVTSVEY